MKQVYSIFIVSFVVLGLILSFNFVVAENYKDGKTNNGLGNIGFSSSITTDGNSSNDNNDTNSSDNNSSDNNSSGNSGGGSSGGGGGSGGSSGGSEGSEGSTKTVICHSPPGNPANAHTIIVGGKAHSAHSNHGDFLGPCEGEVLGNDNTNQTDENLTLSIINPLNITYNITEILINISSKGDNIWYSIDGGNNIIYNGTIIENFSEGSHTLQAFANDTDEELSISVTFNINLPSGNQTIANLTLSIINPQNITYNITEILINISSNSDNIWYSIDGGNNITYTGEILMNFTEGSHILEAFANNTLEEISESVMFDVNLTIISGNETNSTV